MIKFASLHFQLTPDQDFIIDILPGYPNISFGCGFSGKNFSVLISLHIKTTLKLTSIDHHAIKVVNGVSSL